ncbi:Vasopressin V1a receptor [Trichinella nativa]|uniref:Vasopressin V1a receptor n=2 Tax=Trichinella TaxID=6333 RepID=A0A0V1LKL3_9BILA|nr:Vasopressin V1a receptor [Trichinella murrelli]KRX70640.1 Vasopressin V1a receptor [Trichinella sp. T6]KRZ59582.1 Vasopressin V1a receptor [Trichinella nativa]
MTNKTAFNTSDGYDVEMMYLTPDMVFGPRNIMVICCYSVVLLLSAVGNVTMLLILLKNFSRTRSNRVFTLLLHLNIADLLVTFIHMPKEIGHTATVQWLGPDWLCRSTKYMDVFGIYLSSNLLICMCVDRFLAIVHPMFSFRARQNVRNMLIASWIIAALTSSPQFYRLTKYHEYSKVLSEFCCISISFSKCLLKFRIFTFCLANHPLIDWYSQCISAATGSCNLENSTQYVLFNTILNALEIYILPFTAIVFCYGGILWKILHEAKAGKSAASEKGNEASSAFLRRSSYFLIRRAKNKTLRMTFLVVITFLICWTPYFIMVTLHFVDLDFSTGGRLGQIELNPMVENFLYIFAIFNSCVNPYLYGFCSFDLRKELRELCSRHCTISKFKRVRNLHNQNRSTDNQCSSRSSIRYSIES